MFKYVIAFYLGIFLYSCDAPNEEASGEILSRIHCTSCHAYPSSQLLNKKSWDEHVLPRMGYFMGVLPEDSVGGNFIETESEMMAFENPSIFRKDKMLTEEEWKSIRDYYLKNSPLELSTPKSMNIKSELPDFEVHFPPVYLSPPSTTMVRFGESDELMVGDFHTRSLYQFGPEFMTKGKATLKPGVIGCVDLKDGWVVTSIGSFTPSDLPSGEVVYLPKEKEKPPIKLVKELRRPVHTEVADLDGDGRFDLIISEFGKWVGSLAWWKNDGKGNFEKNILRQMPGAVRTVVRDLNQDGLPDIMALFAQGDEGVFIFWNEGNGNFKEERILHFPPSYGSTYFELFDYNGDQFPDIIYTCGDNADFPPIQKPYHGIRIFQNDGTNHFKEALFYPLSGAYKAIPADFNNDGNIDIAAISFFPDFVKFPEGSFVLLFGKKKNPTNANDFSGHTFPEYGKGRWITMDVNDWGEDGDLDIVLGSLAFEVIPDQGEVNNWTKDGIPFVVLENLMVD